MMLMLRRYQKESKGTSVDELLKSVTSVDQFNSSEKIRQLCAELNFDILQTQFDLSYEEGHFKDITGNFLILSDRLENIANKLGTFINERTCGQIRGIISSKDELQEDMLDINYLIIVGYLEEESNFEILDKIRIKNNNIRVILYATYSPTTSRQMSKYGIYCLFERYESLDVFLNLF